MNITSTCRSKVLVNCRKKIARLPVCSNTRAVHYCSRTTAKRNQRLIPEKPTLTKELRCPESPSKYSPPRRFTTTRVSPGRVRKETERKILLPCPTRAVQSARRMPLTESSGTAARGSGRSIDSRGTNKAQKTILMNPSRSCLVALSGTTGPLDDDPK